MKRCKTSDGAIVSLGRSARRIRKGTHGALCEMDAADVPPVPFAQKDIKLWREARKSSCGIFESMGDVENALRTLQVACYLDDHSPTVKALAAKLLDACIFDYPGISKEETFRLCADRPDVLNTVFSSKRIFDFNRMECLIQTIYKSLGFEGPWDLFAARSCDFETHCHMFQTAFDPSDFSEEYGIKCDVRGLAGYADVQQKWATLVASSKGFAAEREAVIGTCALRENTDNRFSATSFGMRLASIARENIMKASESSTSWRCLSKCFDRGVRRLVQSTAPVQARLQAGRDFHAAVLAPILDAQLAAGPGIGILVLTPLAAVRAADEFMYGHRLEAVMSTVARLMGGDLRPLSNLKTVYDRQVINRLETPMVVSEAPAGTRMILINLGP